MHKIVLSLLLLIPSIALSGCQEKYTYEYLMEHPKALKKVIDQCQSRSPLDDAVCKTAERAADDFNELLLEQQSNPERFGERIMAQEIACVDMRTKAADQSSPTVKKETCRKARVMLAVVGLNSPE